MKLRKNCTLEDVSYENSNGCLTDTHKKLYEKVVIISC